MSRRKENVDPMEGSRQHSEPKRSANMLSALGMQLASKYTNVLVQLAVTMILARLLTPEQYGTVAVVTVFTSFFAILADVGVSTAIVQYRNLTKRDYDALFSFCLLLGLGLAALFCALSWPISLIYADSQLVPLCCLASLQVLFAAMDMVPNGILLRQRRFAAVSVRLVVASVLSGALAIGLAALGWGCWALIWQTVASAGIVLVWNWAATRVRLDNWHFKEPLKKIWKFSLFQAGFSTINYFARNLDNLLVGALMGSAQLGQYDKAYKLMGYPLNYLTGVFNGVLQPYLSEYQHQRRRLYESWLGICRMLALVGMFITAVFICFPREIVLVLFGDQWLPAVPAVATLGISVGVQMVNSSSGAIFQSAGRTDRLFASGLICTAVSLAAIMGGVATGSIALLGLCVSLAYVVHICITSRMLVHDVLGQSALGFLRSLLPSTIAAAVAVGATSLVAWLTSSAPTAWNIAARAVVCLVTYALVEWFTGEWRSVLVFRDMKTMGASHEQQSGQEQQ